MHNVRTRAQFATSLGRRGFGVPRVRRRVTALAHYLALKQKLVLDFPSDEVLKRRIAAAYSLDEIIAALGASYRDALHTAAKASADGGSTSGLQIEGAERAAIAREEAILELMAFFDRDRAGTLDISVWKTGARHLRVVSHQPVAGPAADIGAEV